MNLEDVILTQISQAQKDKYCSDSTYMRKLKQTIHRIKEWNSGCQGPRGKGLLIDGHKYLFRRISSKDFMYNFGPEIKNNVNLNILRGKSHIKCSYDNKY